MKLYLLIFFYLFLPLTFTTLTDEAPIETEAELLARITAAADQFQNPCNFRMCETINVSTLSSLLKLMMEFSNIYCKKS